MALASTPRNPPGPFQPPRSRRASRRPRQGPTPGPRPVCVRTSPRWFNLRLPEPDLLKLKYIADQTPDRMQQFYQRVLLPAIEAKIEELTGRTARRLDAP